MVRSETFPFRDYALATPGQLTWVYLNQLVDYDERIRKIHTHCLPKFHQLTCEVCGKPVADVAQFPAEVRERMLKPGKDEGYNFEWVNTDTEAKKNSFEGE